MAGFKNECWKWLVVGLFFAGACAPIEAAVDDGGGGGGSTGGLELGGPGSPSGASGPSCRIGSNGYDGGTLDPSNPCQVCDPVNFTTNWTQLPDGTPCPNGDYCQAGFCRQGCFIKGVVYLPDEAAPKDDCELCQPATSKTAWTPKTDETSCSSNGGNFCSSGTCVAGCIAGGQLYSNGAAEATDSCRVCEPATSTNALSSAADGTACTQNGTYCVAGSCQDVCDIAGTFVDDGTSQPANPNACCNVALSSTTWTPGFRAMDGGADALTGVAGATLADLNNDGYLDLVVTTVTGVEIFTGAGNGAFSLSDEIPGGVLQVAVADLNGDGRSDLAVLSMDDTDQIAAVTVMINAGAPNSVAFSSTSYSVPYPPWNLSVGDFQHAGSHDIAVVGDCLVGTPPTQATQITLLKNQGQGAYFPAAPQIGFPIVNPQEAVVAKFGGGSVDELAIGDGIDQSVTLFRYIGGLLGFQPVTQVTVPTGEFISLAQADINQDGLPDLLVGDIANDNLFVLINSGSSTFGIADVIGLVGPFQLVTGDFNGDGKPDIAAASAPLWSTPVTTVVLLNETSSGGRVAFAAAASYPAWSQALAAGDVSGDGKLDLVSVDNQEIMTLLGSCP